MSKFGRKTAVFWSFWATWTNTIHMNIYCEGEKHVTETLANESADWGARELRGANERAALQEYLSITQLAAAVSSRHCVLLTWAPFHSFTSPTRLLIGQLLSVPLPCSYDWLRFTTTATVLAHHVTSFTIFWETGPSDFSSYLNILRSFLVDLCLKICQHACTKRIRHFCSEHFSKS